MHPLIKGLTKILAVLITLAIIYVLYISIAIVSFGNINELRHADAAIVLGAAVYGDEPSPVFRERINHGIWLYENGYVKKLIFTGGKGKSAAYSDSSIAKKYAIEHKVPESDILIEEKSTITQENIYYAAQIAKKKGFACVLIVSDPLHMKRAMLMAKDVGLAAYSSPTPTTMYRSTAGRLHFLGREVFYYSGYGLYRLFN